MSFWSKLGNLFSWKRTRHVIDLNEVREGRLDTVPQPIIDEELPPNCKRRIMCSVCGPDGKRFRNIGSFTSHAMAKHGVEV